MQGTIGEVRAFAGNYAPTNWKLCDGSLLNISQYETLFTIISTNFGGDGSSTFAVPDLCGKVILNNVMSAYPRQYAVGIQDGREKSTLTSAHLPLHTHAFSVSTADGAVDIPKDNFLAAMVDTGNPTFEVRSYLPDGTTGQTAMTLNNKMVSTAPGTNAPHENRMPYIPINYIICTDGIYPSRG